MLTISNLPTQDNYVDRLTLGPVPTTKLIKYVVANAAVLARIWPQSKSGTIPAKTDELLITPETNIISDAMGIEFRSAVAGTPAQVIAQLLEGGDPIIGSGTPFSDTITSSGGIIVGGGGVPVVGDTKVSAQAATHADPSGVGTWYLADGSALPAAEVALIALVGANVPDGRGRTPVVKGTNAAVNAIGLNDGVALANRRPQHRHNPHAHGPGGGFTEWAMLFGGAGDWLVSVGDPSRIDQIGVSATTGSSDGGSGVATDSLDAPAFIVAGNLFYYGKGS